MPTSVRTKARKKQPPFAPRPAQAGDARRLEQAALDLEDTVFHILNAEPDGAFQDVDFLYWNRTLKNIATQVSLALGEQGGPRQFHQHYRHDPKDHEHLYPVSGPSGLETLIHVCREALSQCAEMVGVQDPEVLRERGTLEQAIRVFLGRCQPQDAKH